MEATQLRRLLDQVPDIEGDIQKINRKGWPLPVHVALQNLKKRPQRYVQDYLNLFEAFIHLHFVTLASQFYWALKPAEIDNQTDAIKAGLSVLCEVLSHAVSGGGGNWLRWSALLSLGCQQFSETTLPFPELATILGKLVIDKRANTAKETQTTDFWSIKQGGECWDFLRALIILGAELERYEPLVLNTLDDKAIEQKLFVIQDSLGHIFQAYHGLQLAMVSETVVDESQQRQVGIYCYWQEGEFLCVSNPADRRDMEEIWQVVTTPGQDLLQAPQPPDPKWHWDDSLLLYGTDAPYRRYVYLMPLGFRYRPQVAQNYLPGLLESVRRKESREISGVIQRCYQEDFSWQATDDDVVQIDTLNQCIEQLVKSLCENFKYEWPSPKPQPLEIPHQFDLHYERLAAQLSANMLARPREQERVLSQLKNSPSQRLLLEGAAGSGKSVLLAQIFQAEPNAVFIGLDIKPEPLAEEVSTDENNEKPKASVALRVGMYCLTVLNRLMQRPPITHILPLTKIQDTLRNHLSFISKQEPQRHFLIIVDGLNQAPDPGGLLSALPEDLPNNLYILASSQPQQRVQQPLTRYGHQQWEMIDMAELAQDEAEAIIWHYWTQPLAGKNTPQHTDFPTNLLKILYRASHGWPIYLEDWTRRLRDLWVADPQNFARQAESHFQQYHATALPEFLKNRLAIVKENAKYRFQPLALLDALLWCLSLIQKALTINELQGAIQVLRQEQLFTDLPAVSKQQIEDGLSWLGGFVRSLSVGFEERWQLQHEILGQWFCKQYGQVEDLSRLRLSLVPFGAVPFDATSEVVKRRVFLQQCHSQIKVISNMHTSSPICESRILILNRHVFHFLKKNGEIKFPQWLSQMLEKYYGHYERFSPELKISILESLLINLPKRSSRYTTVVTRLFFVFWDETGEKDRALALRPALTEALSNSSAADKKEISRALKLSKHYLWMKRFYQLIRRIKKFLYQPLF